MACGHAYEGADGEERTCPRSTVDGADSCPIHLDSAERSGKNEAVAALRSQICRDLTAGGDYRLEYANATLPALDLSSLSIDGDGLEALRFRDVAVEGRVDLSGSVIGRAVRFEDCEFGGLDATDCTIRRDLTLSDSRIGPVDTGSTLTLRRASIEGSLHLNDVAVCGGLEAPACNVDGWVDVDTTTVTGDANFPNATFERAQFVDTTVEGATRFTGVRAAHLTVERVRFGDSPRFDGATLGALRFRPVDDTETLLHDAAIDAGRLAQPDDARALYDLTDATLGDVDLDCTGGTLDRYRFYRTRFDGFPFADYREFFRVNRWRLHQYAGGSEQAVTVTDLERTHLEAKQGADDVGDHENAAAFYVRELRYRRQRYADHALDNSRSLLHRFDAALRWLTNAFLDGAAGYGERPQRALLLSVAVIIISALLYPALGGLRADGTLFTYATAGIAALSESLYFSVATFTTLGLGDVRPAVGPGRFVAAAEGLAGAFLMALFVFALGHRVSR